MSILRRGSEPPASARATSPARPATTPTDRSRRLTHVAAGSKIVGTILGGAEVLIEGELEGEVKLDSRVVVGPQGQVLGNITARSVQVSGKLTGDVAGLERVELTASATIEGNLSAPRIVIAEGAFFQGKVEMSAQKARAPETSSPGQRPVAAGTSPPPRTAPDEDRNPKRS